MVFGGAEQIGEIFADEGAVEQIFTIVGFQVEVSQRAESRGRQDGQ